jgi:hypothetical protein
MSLAHKYIQHGIHLILQYRECMELPLASPAHATIFEKCPNIEEC